MNGEYHEVVAYTAPNNVLSLRTSIHDDQWLCTVHPNAFYDFGLVVFL